MATEHYGLTGSGADAPTIDKLLFRGAESHQHRGGARPFVDPGDPLGLELQAGAGLIPGGTDVHYRYTLVNGEGFQSGPSPDGVISTPPPAPPPANPALSAGDGQVAAGGNYLYAISAWRASSSRETVPSAQVRYFMAFEARTGVTVTPAGAIEGMDGYNVYRRAPGDYVFSLIGTVEGWQPWTDDGTAEPNMARTLPTFDTSNLGNSVRLTLPGEVPPGYHWALYRTYTADWANSLVALLVSTEPFVDTGAPTQPGAPPAASELPADPERILLTNGSDVVGVLPMGMTTYPRTVLLANDDMWVCEAPHAQLIGVRPVADATSDDHRSAQLLDHAGAVVVEPVLGSGTRVGEVVAPSETTVLEAGDWLSAASDAEGVRLSLQLVEYGYPVTSFQPPP